jgi:hypothetical protein
MKQNPGGTDSPSGFARAPIANFDTGRCLRFLRQAQFDPLKYLEGLVRGTLRRNGRIYAHGTRPSRVGIVPATVPGLIIRAT